ncbi:bacterial alpha-L-rhamnosidase domain-containing protein, partial [Elsinoe ampelina]
EIILDYGRAEGGYPVFGIRCQADSRRHIKFRIVYSETREGIDKADGDGPYFLFSNAMDTYRSIEYTVPTSSESRYYEARFSQGSLRYQKIILLSTHCSLIFDAIGLMPFRSGHESKCRFSCSDPVLTQIWEHGLRTVDKCTVEKGQTQPAWDFLEDRTRVYGQHWAPCRHGTRWADKVVRFQVKIHQGGASWGIHMVANGLIFCLDVTTRELKAFEGLADKSSVFPSKLRGQWALPYNISLQDWTSVLVQTSGSSATVVIDGRTITTLYDLDIHPLLGGASNNTGSIALGGPAGWVTDYRDLAVHGLDGNELYRNPLTSAEQDRTMLDFGVGTNTVACTIDGAKRDRSVFGGDLFILGQAVAYSTAQMEAVKGSIDLLSSHQTKDGYLGNLCPIQAPLHDEHQEVPTYAFYSLEYALLLVIAIKDYWLHTGDDDTVQQVWPKLCKFIDFVQSHINHQGLVDAPPPLSLTFLPLGGPIFGPATHINLAYYQALCSMYHMSECILTSTTPFNALATTLSTSILTHLHNPKTGLLTPSTLLPSYTQQSLSHALFLGLLPSHPSHLPLLNPTSPFPPPAFPSTPPFPPNLISPFTSSFAAEALFATQKGPDAISLIKKVWEPMTRPSDPNYSGCFWEALTLSPSPGPSSSTSPTTPESSTPTLVPAHDDTSLCHGWSTGPVFLLPKYLAGLRPTSPGWKKWEVAPVVAGVRKVEVEMETVAGTVGVRVEWGEGFEGGWVEVLVPGGTEVEVNVPEGWEVVGEGR